MKEVLWNNVIWTAISNSRNLDIDSMFFACEKELRKLGAPQLEIDLRLFALALFCNKTYNLRFFQSLAFLRFGCALDYLHFECVAKRLIEENSYALIVFWAVFRLSFANSLNMSLYLQREKEMREKSLELGTNFCIFKPNTIGNRL